MLSILKENYLEPLTVTTGEALINHSVAELVYHTNRYMQRGSLMENYAIRKLQEQIITQVRSPEIRKSFSLLLNFQIL